MADLLASGFELMLLGMGIVFAFLSILVGSLKVMSGIAGQFATANTLVDMRTQGANAATHIAVISAAIARFRTTQGA